MRDRALLFDIGNVLVRFDFTQAAQRFAEMSDASAEEVLKRLAPFKDDLESGRITNAHFVEQSMALIGFRGTEEDFIRIWGDIFTENVPMVALVRELAGKHPLYLLSNTSGLHKDWLFEKFDIFALFEGGVYSHEAGCMKPHEPIYQLAIQQFNLDPASTFYIDDLGDNIVTGRRLGLVTHHYNPDKHDEMEAAWKLWLAAEA